MLEEMTIASNYKKENYINITKCHNVHVIELKMVTDLQCICNVGVLSLLLINALTFL